MPVPHDGASFPFATAVGYTLLHFLWQGSLIALLTLGSVSCLRRATPNSRYCVLLGWFGLMTICPAATFCVVSNSFVLPTITFPIESSGETGPSIDQPPLALDLPSSTGNTNTFRPEPRWNSLRAWTHNHLEWFVYLWMVGVCVLSSRLLVNWTGVYWIRWRMTLTGDSRIHALCASMCRAMRIRQPVRICESTLIPVPVVVGMIRPVIILPAQLATGLSDEDLRAIVAHELAHIRRHDYLVNLVQLVVENMLFFHPAVWWLSHCLRLEREHCCDDLAAKVCGGKVVLARALTTLAELHASVSLTTPAATGGSLVSRIRRLVNGDSNFDRFIPWAQGAGVLSLFVLLIFGAVVKSGADKTEFAGVNGVQPHPAGRVAQATKTNKRVQVSDDPKVDLSDPSAVRKEIASRLKVLAEKHGYGLNETTHVLRVAHPIPSQRNEVFIPWTPGYTEDFLNQPAISIPFRWKNGELTRWGMWPFYPQNPGASLEILCDYVLGIKSHRIEASPHLLDQGIIGDWVVRFESPEDERLEQLNAILAKEAPIPVRLKFQKVTREVYVSRGTYRLTRLLGDLSEDRTQLIDDGVVYSDRIQVSGVKTSELLKAGGHAGLGDFNDFLDSLGCRIGIPILNETTSGPTRKISWDISVARDPQREWSDDDSETDRMLDSVSKQTELTFEKADREVKFLVVEEIKPKTK